MPTTTSTAPLAAARAPPTARTFQPVVAAYEIVIARPAVVATSPNDAATTPTTRRDRCSATRIILDTTATIRRTRAMAHHQDPSTTINVRPAPAVMAAICTTRRVRTPSEVWRVEVGGRPDGRSGVGRWVAVVIAGHQID